MGKVAKVVAGIALTVAIAVFAPALGAAFLTAIGTAATGTALAAATALAASVMAVAGGALMMALSKPPGSHPPGRAPTAALPTRTNAAFQLVQDDFPACITNTLAPVDPGAMRRPFFLPWQRYAVSRTIGDCMVPDVPKGGFVVVDRLATINPGDLLVFKSDDLMSGGYLLGENWWTRWRTSGLVKRYSGCDADTRTVYFHCIFPKLQRIAAGQGRLTYAYRVVSTHRSLLQAWSACRALRKR